MVRKRRKPLRLCLVQSLHEIHVLCFDLFSSLQQSYHLMLFHGVISGASVGGDGSVGDGSLFGHPFCSFDFAKFFVAVVVVARTERLVPVVGPKYKYHLGVKER